MTDLYVLNKKAMRKVKHCLYQAYLEGYRSGLKKEFGSVEYERSDLPFNNWRAMKTQQLLEECGLVKKEE